MKQALQLLGILVAVYQGLAQVPERPLDRVFKQAEQAERNGDFRGAVDKYEDAKRLAVETNDKRAGSRVAINQARAIQTVIATDRSETARVEQVVGNYQFAIENGSPEEKIVAQNNLGALLLQQNKPAEALRVLEQMDVSLVDLPNRFLAQYNLGRARELNNDPKSAWTNYIEAVRWSPGYRPAIEGAFRVAYRASPRDVKGMSEVATNLIARGELRTVERELQKALLLCARDPGVETLLAARVRYYISAPLLPSDFDSSERDFLNQLSERAPALQGYIRELTNAYTGAFKLPFNPAEARSLFPHWTKQAGHTRLLSDLLGKVGDYYSRKGPDWSAERLEKALSSYLTSWLVEPRNTKPAVAVAAILRENRDWKPSRDVLVDRFVEVVFDVKSGFYAFGSPEQPEDLVNLLRLRLILASIFEEKSQWQSGRQFQNVIFQLTQALAIESQLQNRKADYVPSPGLRDRLGNAYEQTGSAAKAWEQYVQAGESFVRLANAERARVSLLKARSIFNQLNPEQQQRLAALDAMISRLDKP